ncbi:MAG: GspE/PulE family protein [Patescibacteria group bacterium]
MPPLPIPSNQLKARLLEENLITSERFDMLLEEATHKGQSLIDLLVSEKVVPKEYLNNILAVFLGVEIANLGARGIDEESLKSLAEPIARERQAIVFGKSEDGSFLVAMADPSDLATIEFLTQHLRARIKPFLANQDDLARGFSIYGSELTSNFKKIIEENIQASLRSQTKTSAEAAAELPVVAIVDNILSYAISLHASDIHIEALEETTLIRYRIDGILYEMLRIPKAVHSAIVARLKLLSGLKLDEHHEPQDGRFRQQIGAQALDVRVSVMPTSYGEKIVMRLLESTQKPLSLEELGMLPKVAEIVSKNLKKSYGMILSCGPTGSGKTTTLYALINMLNKPNVNIVTIEDPIEYNMRFVNQSQINVQAGITFASGLRALLRQDPNIIMVGEIRDKETADISVQASLTGHLLVSSLHTNDAPTAIPRLFDLGVPPFLVSSTLNLVVAQRLVRRVCNICMYSYEPGEGVKKTVYEELEKLGVSMESMPKLFYQGKGCTTCSGTGYRGRLGIFEVLELTENVRVLMGSPDFTLEKLREEARKGGMDSMFEDGLKKVELAVTTVEEVLRVIRE